MRRVSRSVVLPIFRNRESLDELYDRLCRALASLPDFELIFVEDRGDDGSLEYLESLAERDERLGVIGLARPEPLPARGAAGPDLGAAARCLGLGRRVPGAG